jgi:SAM-dependent methyltransferase
VQADYAKAYRTLWERHWWWRSREAYVLGRLERIHRRAAGGALRLLDVGCGDGLFFDRLERFGRVEGLEPDASLLDGERRDARIVCGTLGPDFDPGPVYDVVLMLDVLEHIADDGAALRAARAVLRPGGTLLITVPALAWLWSRHDVVNAHHRRYHPGPLRAALRGAGFEVETVRYFFAWTVGPLLLRRWLHPAGARGRNVAADYAVGIPPAPLNRALTALSRAEHAAGRFVRWPLGSSLLAEARAR